MTNFLFKEEKKISKEFENKGFVIKKINDLKSLTKIRSFYIKSIIHFLILHLIMV